MLKTYLLALGLAAQVWMGWGAMPPAQEVHTQNSALMQEGLKPVEANTGDNYVNPVVSASEDVDIVQKIADMGIKLHPGSEYDKGSINTVADLDRCAGLVYQTLQALPDGIARNLKDLTLYFTNTGRRGLGGGSTIILRCKNVTDKELVSVLVHEMGHIEDTGELNGNFWTGASEFKDGKNAIYIDDKSLDFYRISFTDEKTRKANSSDLDFVSGYAKTDAFEDFAESYNFYLLHGDKFRMMAGANEKLMKKYEFMRDIAFSGKEYENDASTNSGSNKRRSFDVTVLDYDMKKFLAI